MIPSPSVFTKPDLLLVMLYCFCRTVPGGRLCIKRPQGSWPCESGHKHFISFLCLSGLWYLELCDLQHSKRYLQTETVVFLHVINKSIKQPSKVWLWVTLGEPEEPGYLPHIIVSCFKAVLQELSCCCCGHEVDFSCFVTNRQRISWIDVPAVKR